MMGSKVVKSKVASSFDSSHKVLVVWKTCGCPKTVKSTGTASETQLPSSKVAKTVVVPVVKADGLATVFASAISVYQTIVPAPPFATAASKSSKLKVASSFASSQS